jgi:hypothetical protein
MATLISNGEASTHFGRPSAAPSSLIASPAVTDVEVDTLTASSTVTSSGLVAPDSFGVLSADGAVTISAATKTYFITKASAAAITIADPTSTTHDGVTLTFVATTAAAHTVSNAAGSGFNAAGAAGDVATFGGAKGDCFSITAYQGKWYTAGALRNVTIA